MASSTAEPLTPRAREIVEAARELLEQEGRDALSMRQLAERVGIRAPSIYKHFTGKDALEAALISIGLREQGALFEAALDASGEPLAAMAQAYRAFAHRHPHLWRLMSDGPLDRTLLIPGAEERAVAPVVRAAGGDRDLARATWAFAHGMTILELDGRFPPDADLDAAWRRGIEALQARARRRR
jgi:AcrR family transcriptional regulator